MAEKKYRVEKALFEFYVQKTKASQTCWTMEYCEGHSAVEADARKKMRHEGFLEGGALGFVEIGDPERIRELGPEDVAESELGFVTGEVRGDKPGDKFSDVFLPMGKFVCELSYRV